MDFDTMADTDTSVAYVRVTDTVNEFRSCSVNYVASLGQGGRQNFIQRVSVPSQGTTHEAVSEYFESVEKSSDDVSDMIDLQSEFYKFNRDQKSNSSLYSSNFIPSFLRKDRVNQYYYGDPVEMSAEDGSYLIRNSSPRNVPYETLEDEQFTFHECKLVCYPPSTMGNANAKYEKKVITAFNLVGSLSKQEYTYEEQYDMTGEYGLHYSFVLPTSRSSSIDVRHALEHACLIIHNGRAFPCFVESGMVAYNVRLHAFDGIQSMITYLCERGAAKVLTIASQYRNADIRIQAKSNSYMPKNLGGCLEAFSEYCSLYQRIVDTSPKYITSAAMNNIQFGLVLTQDDIITSMPHRIQGPNTTSAFITKLAESSLILSTSTAVLSSDTSGLGMLYVMKTQCHRSRDNYWGASAGIGVMTKLLILHKMCEIIDNTVLMSTNAINAIETFQSIVPSLKVMSEMSSVQEVLGYVKRSCFIVLRKFITNEFSIPVTDSVIPSARSYATVSYTDDTGNEAYISTVQGLQTNQVAMGKDFMLFSPPSTLSELRFQTFKMKSGFDNISVILRRFMIDFDRKFSTSM